MNANAPSNLELDAETMRRLGHRVADAVVEHLTTLRQQPAQQSLSRADARRTIATPPPEEGKSFDEIMEFLDTRVFPNHAREPHPHFMGYIPSSPTFPAVLGDWLASGYNFFAGVWSVASGPNEIELLVLDWFRQWLGMPEGTSGLITSGGRRRRSPRSSLRDTPPIRQRFQLPRMTIYTSDQAHSSVERAAWIVGVPRANVRSIATDDDFRMRVGVLRDAITADRAAGMTPFAIVASAGTTNTGAVDPLSEIADVCARESLWLHVDAAYAGFAALTESGAMALRGIERADSVTLDPHKWLFVPFECGCLLARDPRRLEEAFSVHPEYLTDVRAREHEVNFADLGPQLTRAAHALKIWTSVSYFGVAEVREAIARGIRRAEYAARRLSTMADFEILSPPQFGVICFRARPAGATEQELDALNERINARVNGTGRFLTSSTRLRGRFSLRLCTQVHRMTEADVDEVLDAMAEALDSERAAVTASRMVGVQDH